MKRVALLLGVLVIAACGGGGGGGSTGTTPSGVVLNVTNANLGFGQALLLRGTVTGESSQTITWSATGGTIEPLSASEARYTAPATAGTYTITARSAANTNKFGTCTARVESVGITISPDNVLLGPGAKTRFTGTVSGSTNVTANFGVTGGSVVRINASTVEYTAPTVAGNYVVTATAAANPNRRAEAQVTVANVGANAIVQGRVVNGKSNAGLANVVVAFFNSSNQELARATTATDGRFTATVPVSARRFHVIGNSVPVSFYQQYEFGGMRYSTLIPSCTAPTPTLTAGQTAVLSSNLALTPTTEAPPPPPTGCG